MGTRFINMGFLSPAAGGVIFTVPTTTSGLAFYGCHFDGRSTVAATIGILATAVEQFTVEGCRFYGKYSTATISIGTGSGRAMLIKNNIIESGAIGITVNASYTCADSDGMILNNMFDVVTIIVEDLSDKCMVSGNRGHSDSNGSLDETFDTNALLSSDNIFACSAGTQSYYPAFASIPA
jgi:hypothetical protein